MGMTVFRLSNYACRNFSFRLYLTLFLKSGGVVLFFHPVSNSSWQGTLISQFILVCIFLPVMNLPDMRFAVPLRQVYWFWFNVWGFIFCYAGTASRAGDWSTRRRPYRSMLSHYVTCSILVCVSIRPGTVRADYYKFSTQFETLSHYWVPRCRQS